MINPLTGQPDYSAHWVAYYRSVGMHNEANAIEAKMMAEQQQLASSSSYYQR